MLVLTSTQCAEDFEDNEDTEYQEELKKGSRDVIIQNMSGEAVQLYTTKFLPKNKYLLLTPDIALNWMSDMLNAYWSVANDGEAVDKIPIHLAEKAEYRYQILAFKESTIDDNERSKIVEENIYDFYGSYTYEELKEIGFVITITDHKKEKR